MTTYCTAGKGNIVPDRFLMITIFSYCYNILLITLLYAGHLSTVLLTIIMILPQEKSGNPSDFKHVHILQVCSYYCIAWSYISPVRYIHFKWLIYLSAVNSKVY